MKFAGWTLLQQFEIINFSHFKFGLFQIIFSFLSFILSADPLVNLRIVERDADSRRNLLGGWVFHAKCSDGFFFENTGKSYHKEKCICRYDDHEYSCSKSTHFHGDLGNCIAYTGPPTTEPGSSTRPNNHWPNNGPNGGNAGSGLEDINWLDYKRVKFTSFMRSLYDTFWEGASRNQAEMF